MNTNAFVVLPALANGDEVSALDANKGRAAVSGHVLVALLVAIVLWHIVQVVAAHNDGALHLGADDSASQDASADGDVAGEGALLVDVGSGDGLLGRLEAKTDVLEPAGALALGDDALVVEEDGLLLLEAALGLK